MLSSAVLGGVSRAAAFKGFSGVDSQQVAGGTVALPAILLVCAFSPECYKQRDKRELKYWDFRLCQLFLCPVWYLCTSLVLRKLAKLSWQGCALVCESFPGLFLAEEYPGEETGQWAGLAKNRSCKIEAKISQDGGVLQCGLFSGND